MAQWVRLCGAAESPEEGKLAAVEVNGMTLCVSRVGGTLRAMENVCPHRRAPLAEGWMEGNSVVCPWHSWEFDVESGRAAYPEGEKVEVFALKAEGDEVLVDLEGW